MFHLFASLQNIEDYYSSLPFDEIEAEYEMPPMPNGANLDDLVMYDFNVPDDVAAEPGEFWLVDYLDDDEVLHIGVVIELIKRVDRNKVTGERGDYWYVATSFGGTDYVKAAYIEDYAKVENDNEIPMQNMQKPDRFAFSHAVAIRRNCWNLSQLRVGL